jgi:hypothetical protein
MLASFFGQILLLVIIACGLLYLISPQAGRELAKRGGISLLLFFGCLICLPGSDAGALWAAVRWLAGLALGLSALLYLAKPEQAGDLVRGAVSCSALLLVLYMGWLYVWSTAAGRVIVTLMLLAATILLLGLRSRRQ